jgi:heme-degrading monooxygenase HmoA
MDELLAAQITLEEVEDNIQTSSGLFETEQFKRISAALHYAARYLHDVFEDFEKGRVEREEDSYVIVETCKNLRDFASWLGRPRKAAVHAQQHLVFDKYELEMESVGD